MVVGGNNNDDNATRWFSKAEVESDGMVAMVAGGDKEGAWFIT